MYVCMYVCIYSLKSQYVANKFGYKYVTIELRSITSIATYVCIATCICYIKSIYVCELQLHVIYVHTYVLTFIIVIHVHTLTVHKYDKFL